MRRSRRIVALLLSLIIVSALFPVSSFAAYKYQNLKFNQWYQLSESSDNMTIYKIRVASDTVVYTAWKNHKTDEGYVGIYTDKNCDERLEYILGDDDGKTGTKGFALYPGTYYIYMRDDDKNTQVQFTKKTVKAINKPNYCIQNAIQIKANKKAEFAQTKMQCYNRWYKIKLTKRQKITIPVVTKKYTVSCSLYDSNLNYISCKQSESTNTITTYGEQAKGTYYLMFEDDYSELRDSGCYYSFYWK